MRLIRNSGADRVVDELRRCITAHGVLDVATPALSLFAFAELQGLLDDVARCRLMLPAPRFGAPAFLGTENDRPFRNRLQTRWLARQCAAWLAAKADVRAALGAIPQATLSVGSAQSGPTRVITGTCAFTTEGLGLTPSNGLSLIQVAESAEECALLGAWFTTHWNSLPASGDAKRVLLEQLRDYASDQPPALVYFLTLYHLFKDLSGDLDEDRIVRAATGIRDFAALSFEAQKL